jgi:hypothetical protein
MRPRVYGRFVYVKLALGAIALGLLVHFYGDMLRSATRDVIGDALWAAMIAWWIAAIVPDRSLGARSVAAVVVCFAVELSQLYHTSALDALRASTIGHLILGSGFDPRDFVAYAIGVLATVVCERIMRANKRGT